MNRPPYKTCTYKVLHVYKTLSKTLARHMQQIDKSYSFLADSYDFLPMTCAKLYQQVFLIFLAQASIEAISRYEWKNIPGTFSHVSGSINYIWAVNPSKDIFVCNKPCTGTWRRISGCLNQVDVGDMEVWGICDNAIYKRPADGSGKWECVCGKLKHVSASGNGYIWGVNAANQVFNCKKPCCGCWKSVTGARLKQVDAGEEFVFGVNPAGVVHRRNVDGSGGWTTIPGRKFKYVTAGVNEVFGVDAASNVFRCPSSCRRGNWEKVDFCVPIMDQIEASLGELQGLAKNSIFTTRID